MLFRRLRRLVASEVNAARRRWSERADADAPEPGSEPRGGRQRGARPRRPAVDEDLAKHYARLEVPYGSDLQTVRKGYRRMMKRYHPDRHSSDTEKARVANEVAAALSESYDELTRRLEGAAP